MIIMIMTQSMNYLAAHVVMVVRHEETAFWIIAALVETFFVGYYADRLPMFLLDQGIFVRTVEKQLPELAKRMAEFPGGTETFVPLWFLCSYVNSFSTSQSARVWDLLFLGARTHGAIAAPAILIQVSCIFMSCVFILSYN